MNSLQDVVTKDWTLQRRLERVWTSTYASSLVLYTSGVGRWLVCYWIGGSAVKKTLLLDREENFAFKLSFIG